MKLYFHLFYGLVNFAYWIWMFCIIVDIGKYSELKLFFMP